MLIKITNHSPEFEAKVNLLKDRLNIAVGSKVAEYCTENYTDLDVRYQKALADIEALECKLAIIRDALYAKAEADNDINEALKEC